MMRCSLSPWTTTPSPRSVALMCAVPPRTLARPKRASSLPKCARPFSNGSSVAPSRVAVVGLASAEHQVLTGPQRFGEDRFHRDRRLAARALEAHPLGRDLLATS